MTSQGLHTFWVALCTYFDSIGVIDLERKTLSAKFTDARTVKATFVSQHLLRGWVLSDEIFAHGALIRIDGLWLIQESRYASTIEAVSRTLGLPRASG